MIASRFEGRATKIASGILSQPEFLGMCKATDKEKQDELCFLPRRKANKKRCEGCKYLRGISPE